MTIDPDTGRSVLRGEWPRFGWFDQHFLRTDRDGGVLMIASSKKHHHHAIVRLELHDEKAVPSGFRMRPRALAHAPVVDAAGYWLITSKQNGRLDVDRLADLDLVPAHGLAQVGQCW